MHIALFGATGGTGRHVLTHALERGHTVTVLVRDPARLEVEHPALHVVQGDATDPVDVRRTLAGADAVVSALGAPPSSRAGLRARATAVQVEAMRQVGLRRLVSLSTLGVGDSASRMPWYLTWLIVPLYLRRAFADHAEQERVLHASDLDWTVVRPTFMNDRPATGAVRPRLQVTPRQVGRAVSRADVARFLVDEVEASAWVQGTAELVGEAA